VRSIARRSTIDDRSIDRIESNRIDRRDRRDRRSVGRQSIGRAVDGVSRALVVVVARSTDRPDVARAREDRREETCGAVV